MISEVVVVVISSVFALLLFGLNKRTRSASMSRDCSEALSNLQKVLDGLSNQYLDLNKKYIEANENYNALLDKFTKLERKYDDLKEKYELEISILREGIDMLVEQLKSAGLEPKWIPKKKKGDKNEQ